MNALSKITAFLIFIGLVFFMPLLHTFENHDALAKLTAQNAVTKFVDSVRNKGFITPQMYKEFTTELESTNYVFDVKLTHEQKVYNPVYTDPADSNTFTGEYKVVYDDYYTQQIMNTLFPDNSLPLEDESREYKLKVGDYFKVEVFNKNRTNATILRDFFSFGDANQDVVIFIPYGGMVNNEDY
jgi:hypothetical protein